MTKVGFILAAAALSSVLASPAMGHHMAARPDYLAQKDCATGQLGHAYSRVHRCETKTGWIARGDVACSSGSTRSAHNLSVPDPLLPFGE